MVDLEVSRTVKHCKRGHVAEELKRNFCIFSSDDFQGYRSWLSSHHLQVITETLTFASGRLPFLYRELIESCK